GRWVDRPGEAELGRTGPAGPAGGPPPPRTGGDRRRRTASFEPFPGGSIASASSIRCPSAPRRPVRSEATYRLGPPGNRLESYRGNRRSAGLLASARLIAVRASARLAE